MEDRIKHFPKDYPAGSLQRDLYNWVPGYMDRGSVFETGQEFIARLLKEHPEEVSVFIAKWKMGLFI